MAPQQEQLLSNPLREEIVKIIERAPATVSVIIELTEASYPTVAYHLRVLCRASTIYRVENEESDPEDPLYELCP